MVNKLVSKMQGTSKKSPSPSKSKPKQSTARDTPVLANPTLSASDRRYKAEDALRTITHAEALRGDKQLMKDVHKLASDNMASVSRALSGSSRKK